MQFSRVVAGKIAKDKHHSGFWMLIKMVVRVRDISHSVHPNILYKNIFKVFSKILYNNL